jgi:hypothetical protein
MRHANEFGQQAGYCGRASRLAKVFWFFFPKKNKEKTLLFE